MSPPGDRDAGDSDLTALAELRADVGALTPQIIALRRELHRHPELAFEEVWTAATLASTVRALGLTTHEGVGGTGVVAVLEGAGPGKTLLIRADIDALAMEDATGTDYASRLPGHNHACGHDANSAIVAGVAEILTRHRQRIAGRAAFVFQPADEPMRGARRMIEDGLLDLVRPDMSLGIHVLPMARTGQVVVQRGPLWASRDELTLKVMAGPAEREGAAMDFARVVAELTTALYRVVQEEGRSREAVTFRVRSLGAQRAGPVWLGGPRGEPDGGAVEINLALYDNGLRTTLLRRIEEVGRAIAGAAGGELRVDVDHALPALCNDDHVTGALERAATAVGADILVNWRNPFSDDFGLFMAEAPGCLMLLGTANPAKGITEAWHRPGFDIDEEALPLGVLTLSLAALDLLR